MKARGTATLTGSSRQPALILRFDPKEPHRKNPKRTLLEWAKWLPQAYFSRADQGWVCTATGPNPDRIMRRAGVEVDFVSETAGTDLEGVTSLNDLVTPVAKLSSLGSNVLVRHRLLGYERTKELLGHGARWDRTHKRFVVPLADVLIDGEPRAGIIFPERTVEAAREAVSRVHTKRAVADAVAQAGVAKDLTELDPDTVAQLVRTVGDVPGWFGLDLYPFQRAGAIAVAAGHTGLFDEPGLGKAHPLSEPVLTPGGWRPIGDLARGDFVIGSDGRRTPVEQVFDQGTMRILRVHLSDGTYARCTVNHLWTVEDDDGSRRTIDTKQIANEIADSAGESRIALPGLRQPVRFAERPDPDFDPYEFGRTLGSVPVPREHLDAVMWGSVATRAATVHGILDEHGVLPRDMGTRLVRCRLTHPAVGDVLAHLVRSLGGWVAASDQGRNTVDVRVGMGQLPFRDEALLRRWLNREASPLPRRMIVSVTGDGVEDARCIRVAAHDHLYLTRSFLLTHNTRQVIAAAAIHKAERTVITTLPVGLTGWESEVTASGLATGGGKHPDGEVVVFRSGRKEPELPARGVAILSDGLLSSRPELLKRLRDWAPDVVAFDEAHRAKTAGSQRSNAMLALASAAKRPAIMATGTPLFQSPHELVPLLEATGHMGPVFGSTDDFLNRYCRADKWGGWHARQEHMPELRAKLARHVWVRRTKKQVLPELPGASLVARHVDVPLTEFNRAHREVFGVVRSWVADVRKTTGEDPTEEMVDEFCMTQVGLVTMLRKAAGVAKVPAAVDIIRQFVDETTEIVDGKPVYTRPLIVWTHHRDVSDAMVAALPSAVDATGIIYGGTSAADRDKAVADFQAGKLAVIVCSIAAAGVAITLTRSSDVLFVESDWTPAAIGQAIDRAVRIGQRNHVTVTTLLAPGTLDMRIQKVLQRKSKVLDAVLEQGHDFSVIGESDEVTDAADIIRELVAQALKR